MTMLSPSRVPIRMLMIGTCNPLGLSDPRLHFVPLLLPPAPHRYQEPRERGGGGRSGIRGVGRDDGRAEGGERTGRNDGVPEWATEPIDVGSGGTGLGMFDSEGNFLSDGAPLEG